MVAGCAAYAGAAYLTAMALLRTGAGLVTLAVPQSIASRYTPSEIIIHPIPELSSSGYFDTASIEPLLNLLPGKDVLILGQV